MSKNLSFNVRALCGSGSGIGCAAVVGIQASSQVYLQHRQDDCWTNEKRNDDCDCNFLNDNTGDLQPKQYTQTTYICFGNGFSKWRTRPVAQNEFFTSKFELAKFDNAALKNNRPLEGG